MAKVEISISVQLTDPKGSVEFVLPPEIKRLAERMGTREVAGSPDSDGGLSDAQFAEALAYALEAVNHDSTVRYEGQEKRDHCVVDGRWRSCRGRVYKLHAGDDPFRIPLREGGHAEFNIGIDVLDHSGTASASARDSDDD